MILTSKQQAVIDELHKICRHNALMYRESCPHLYQENLAWLGKGDPACVFRMGGLTFQIAVRLKTTAGSVLAVFKALEKKGLVIPETRAPSYKRPLYWWPVGFAAQLHSELNDQEGGEQS